MRTIPFPLSVNIGTDIVYIPRIQRLITRPSRSNCDTWSSLADRFVRRIMNDQETQLFYSKFGYADGQLPSRLTTVPPQSLGSADSHHVHEMARWIAGRFAAKEAARKAAPGGAASVSWKDVMVQTEGTNGGAASERPQVIYLKEGGRVGEVGKLSISHDGSYVVATVLAAVSASAPTQFLSDPPAGASTSKSSGG